MGQAPCIRSAIDYDGANLWGGQGWMSHEGCGSSQARGAFTRPRQTAPDRIAGTVAGRGGPFSAVPPGLDSRF